MNHDLENSGCGSSRRGIRLGCRQNHEERARSALQHHPRYSRRSARRLARKPYRHRRRLGHGRDPRDRRRLPAPVFGKTHIQKMILRSKQTPLRRLFLLYGIINKNGESIVKTKYKAIDLYSNYYLVVDNNDNMAVYDKDYKNIIIAYESRKYINTGETISRDELIKVIDKINKYTNNAC